MTKKVRRVRKPKAGTETAVEAAQSPQLSSEEEYRLEYAYVIKDLRRIFVIAVAMFALLITLNLLL